MPSSHLQRDSRGPDAQLRAYVSCCSTPRNYESTATVGGVNLYYISPFLYLAKLTKLEPNHQYFYYIKNSANPSAPP
jgi:hypothetical protein